MPSPERESSEVEPYANSTRMRGSTMSTSSSDSGDVPKRKTSAFAKPIKDKEPCVRERRKRKAWPISRVMLALLAVCYMSIAVMFIFWFSALLHGIDIKHMCHDCIAEDAYGLSAMLLLLIIGALTFVAAFSHSRILTYIAMAFMFVEMLYVVAVAAAVVVIACTGGNNSHTFQFLLDAEPTAMCEREIRWQCSGYKYPCNTMTPNTTAFGDYCLPSSSCLSTTFANLPCTGIFEDYVKDNVAWFVVPAALAVVGFLLQVFASYWLHRKCKR